MRGGTSLVRAATLAVLVVAVAVTAIVLFGTGGGGYTVEGRFVNAGQLVVGNPVQSGGVSIGSVKHIGLADNGGPRSRCRSTPTTPRCPSGTRAAIRQSSLSGIANRYVGLTFPGHTGGKQAARFPTGAG